MPIGGLYGSVEGRIGRIGRPSVPFSRVSLVRLRDAVVLTGRFPALAGVDLDVEAGEAVLLQGPNGAGKTTLLRLCAGLMPLERGTGEVLGHDLRRLGERRALRRRVGLVGHASFLYDDLTAWENTRFWAAAAQVPERDVGPALARVGIEGRLTQLAVGAMSAGQKRRVSLAAVIARRPELWLLDEPHAGLDSDGRDIVDELVREATRAGATVIISSHELERARAIAPRMITIAGGAVLVAPSPPQPSRAAGQSGVDCVA